VRVLDRLLDQTGLRLVGLGGHGLSPDSLAERPLLCRARAARPAMPMTIGYRSTTTRPFIPGWRAQM
jgi:hypothetical protein